MKLKIAYCKIKLVRKVEIAIFIPEILSDPHGKLIWTGLHYFTNIKR